jgi:hypothetical protein
MHDRLSVGWQSLLSPLNNKCYLSAEDKAPLTGNTTELTLGHCYYKLDLPEQSNGRCVVLVHGALLCCSVSVSVSLFLSLSSCFSHCLSGFLALSISLSL